jgi:hypothetical protein
LQTCRLKEEKNQKAAAANIKLEGNKVHLWEREKREREREGERERDGHPKKLFQWVNVRI